MGRTRHHAHSSVAGLFGSLNDEETACHVVRVVYGDAAWSQTFIAVSGPAHYAARGRGRSTNLSGS